MVPERATPTVAERGRRAWSERWAIRGRVASRQGRGVGLSSADQCNIADTTRQYCLGSAADSPTPLPFAGRTAPGLRCGVEALPPFGCALSARGRVAPRRVSSRPPARGQANTGERAGGTVWSGAVAVLPGSIGNTAGRPRKTVPPASNREDIRPAALKLRRARLFGSRARTAKRIPKQAAGIGAPSGIFVQFFRASIR
jgi:hypothetical protein